MAKLASLQNTPVLLKSYDALLKSVSHVFIIVQNKSTQHWHVQVAIVQHHERVEQGLNLATSPGKVQLVSGVGMEATNITS